MLLGKAMVKDSMLHIRVSSEDLELIKETAERLGMTQSEFCLNSILSACGKDISKPAIDGVLARLAVLERAVFHQQVA